MDAGSGVLSPPKPGSLRSVPYWNQTLVMLDRAPDQPLRTKVTELLMRASPLNPPLPLPLDVAGSSPAGAMPNSMPPGDPPALPARSRSGSVSKRSFGPKRSRPVELIPWFEPEGPLNPLL